MSAMASQITGVSMVYSILGSGGDQRRNQIYARHWSHLWGEFTGHSHPHPPPHITTIPYLLGYFKYVVAYYFTEITTSVNTIYYITTSRPIFHIKMSSYQCRKSHCGDKTIIQPSYLHNWISYTGKPASLYWIGTPLGYFRYMVILYPMKIKSMNTIFRAKLLVVVAWVLGFAMASPVQAILVSDPAH